MEKMFKYAMTPREIIEASVDMEFLKRIPYITIGELDEVKKTHNTKI